MAPHAEDASDYRGSAPATQAPEMVTVDSPSVIYTDDAIHSKYIYRTTSVRKSVGSSGYVAVPKETNYDFKVERHVGKVGVMFVGWGGNNGSTATAGILANRDGLTWPTREGQQAANYYGSLVMGSTMKLGTDGKTGEDVHIPFHRILPMAHPKNLVIGGWDISSMNLADAMDRAKVLEPSLKALLRKEMSQMKPRPSIYFPDFIAANQEERADNIIPGAKASMAHVEQIRKDIR